MSKNLFVLSAMVVISCCLGFVIAASFSLSMGVAANIAIGLFVLQSMGYLSFWKTSFDFSTKRELEDLTLKEAETAGAVDLISKELKGFKKAVTMATQKEIEPLAAELEVITSLIKQLAENASDNEQRIFALEATLEEQTLQHEQEKQRREKLSHVTEETEVVHALDEEPPASFEDAPEPFNPEDHRADHFFEPDPEPDAQPESVQTIENPEKSPQPIPVVDTESPVFHAVKNAVAQNRIDLYLQPIVSLPDRKPQFYEALSRIRREDGDLIRPAEYLSSAQHIGVMPILDKMLLIRAVQVLQRLLVRKSNSVVICNIAASSIADTSFFKDFRTLLQTKSNLADHLIFEFNQETVEAMSAIEEESLRSLKELGFRFAIDNVTNLSIDHRHLVDLGFHFVKIPAHILLDADKNVVRDIHVQDVPRFLERNGLEVIVDHIENENQIINLLEFDINYGQGYLFAAPREVKPDMPSQPNRTQNDTRLAS